MRVWFVYVDYTDDGRPFYVGKGTHKRLRIRERNSHWKNISRKHGWRRQVVLATRDEKFAFTEEQRLIHEHGTFYGAQNYVWGANKTAGGEGASGRYQTETANERNRKAHLGKRHIQESLEKFSGEKNHRSKLTQHTVNLIRERYASTLHLSQRDPNRMTCAKLAIEYNISVGNVSNILNHRTWN